MSLWWCFRGRGRWVGTANADERGWAPIDAEWQELPFLPNGNGNGRRAWARPPYTYFLTFSINPTPTAAVTTFGSQAAQKGVMAPCWATAER